MFKYVKFKDPKFMRIDLKHSYFSNYFIICLPSIFSVVEIIIELFVVCQNIIMFMHNLLLYKEILKHQI